MELFLFSRVPPYESALPPAHVCPKKWQPLQFQFRDMHLSFSRGTDLWRPGTNRSRGDFPRLVSIEFDWIAPGRSPTACLRCISLQMIIAQTAYVSHRRQWSRDCERIIPAYSGNWQATWHDITLQTWRRDQGNCAPRFGEGWW